MHSLLLPVRRNLLAVAVSIGLAACGGAETALEDTIVVSLPGDTLSAAALRDILLLAPTLPGEDASIGAVSIWTDLAVVSAAVAGGATLDDEATLSAIMRPAIMERSIQRYGESRAGSVTATAAQVDSVARGTAVRVFRRYMIGPIARTDTARIIAEGRRLVQLKQQAVSHGSASAAMQAMGNAANGIEVSPAEASTRESLDEKLAASIWRLNENELSDPILGAGGIQLFERVPSASARDQIVAWLGPVMQRRADARYIDSIMANRGIAVTDDGSGRVRAAAVEPGLFASDATLATWNGGDLTPSEARGWLAMMPAPERARMRLASDTSLTQTLDRMARREILFELAASSGVDTIAVRDELLPLFREQLRLLVADATAAGDPTVWFRDLLEGRRQFLPLPGTLPMVLRDRTQITVDDAARVTALEEAARLWQAPGTAPTP